MALRICPAREAASLDPELSSLSRMAETVALSKEPLRPPRVDMTALLRALASLDEPERPSRSLSLE